MRRSSVRFRQAAPRSRLRSGLRRAGDADAHRTRLDGDGELPDLLPVASVELVPHVAVELRRELAGLRLPGRDSDPDCVARGAGTLTGRGSTETVNFRTFFRSPPSSSYRTSRSSFAVSLRAFVRRANGDFCGSPTAVRTMVRATCTGASA